MGTPQEAETGETLRVLFFEDEIADIELSLRTLRAAHFDVVSDVATTLEEFRDRLRSGVYDIVLSDYRMPGITGMDCFAELQASRVNIPFILVTGSLGDEKAVDCLKDGVSDYVLKDRLVRLPVAVRRALEEQKLRVERAEAEEALRRSEASYRSLIQSAPCGILRLSAADGRLLEGNAALSGMLGYASSADLLRDGASAGIALDPQWLEDLRRTKPHEGQVIETEVEWNRKDGAPLIVGLQGRLLRDREGTPICFEMIAENLTERRLAQKRIAQLNRLYSVLSRVGQMIVRMRNESELFREICRILVEEGRFQMAWVGRLDDLTGQITPAAICPEFPDALAELSTAVDVAPVGQAEVMAAIRENRRMISNHIGEARQGARAVDCGNFRSAGVFPIVVLGRAGGALVMYSREAGFFDEETVALLDELAANLSFALEGLELEGMRNRAVEELHQFFALSLDMLCITGLDGCFRRWNPAWGKTLGYSDRELCGKFWFEFVYPDDRPQAAEALRTLQSGIQIRNLELRFLSKSGSYRWLVGSATPSLEQGAVFGALSDITDRKHLEEQLRSQNVALADESQRANAANRMKSEFLANMSHELRSPLNGIIGFTELLYDGKLGPIPERPHDFLGRIHASATHLLRLINGVLDLSKVEAGRMEFRPEQVSVSAIIQEVTGILGALAADKQIRVEMEIDSSVDQVFIDPGRLKQVLYNYISNALKFTNEGGGVVVRLKREGDKEFRIEVSDTGVGIAPKDMPRLFVEFQQLDATAAKRYQGTGLGLALTRRIVEAQRGRVAVESEPGKGSTFSAVLPRWPGRGQADPIAHILVVEDEELTSLVICETLENAGYSVESVSTWREAVEKCTTGRFDGITLDLLLRDGSGWEALRRIRSRPGYRDTPVIVLSALDEADVTIPEQVQGYLSKPVAPRELMAALTRAGVPGGGNKT